MFWICMNLFPTFHQRPLIPSVAAQRELDELGCDLQFAKRVLEEEHDCARSRRKRNIVEKCVTRNGKEIRVVAAYVEWRGRAFWRIIHVGKTGKHR